MRIRCAGTGVASRPFSFVSAKRKVSWTPKEKALYTSPGVLTNLSGARNLHCLYVMLRCRSCSVVHLLPVFDRAPAAAPRRAAVQATAWWLGRKKTDASAAAALGAGQFRFRTPDTEECTKGHSGFFFWGIQKPVFFFEKTNHPQKVVQPFAERRRKRGLEVFPRPREADSTPETISS